MQQYDLDLQSAFDHVGEMCIQEINTFVETRQQLPSWGPEIDVQVAAYVDGIQDWIIGNLHWSFESERYFGKMGKQVKDTGVVELKPRSQRNR